MSEPCELVSWDTEFFGFPIARVVETTLTEQRVREIDDWCRLRRVRCLYFAAGETFDPMTVALAETNGYRLVNVNVTLHQPVGTAETKHSLLLATTGDIPALEDLAAKSHRDTRFFNDGRFPIERCEQMYRIWVRKCVEQPRKAVIVAHADGAIAGYSAVGHGENDTAAIELIAVAETHRGKGIGEKLVNGSLAWMAERGVRDAYVRTMGHNVTAQRLYQRCGFRTSSTSLYYHKWFDEEGRP